MGMEQLKELHGRMDPILKSLGYTQGSVGERMQALAKDPRYKFSEGDKGRAEIMAYIQQRIGYQVKLDMPMLKGAAVEALYRRGKAWLAGGGLER